MVQRTTLTGVALLAATAAGYASFAPQPAVRGTWPAVRPIPGSAAAHTMPAAAPSLTDARSLLHAIAAAARPQAAWVQQQLQGELEQQQQQQQQRCGSHPTQQHTRTHLAYRRPALLLTRPLPTPDAAHHRRAVIRAPSPDMVATGPSGMFTQSNPEDRRVKPDEVGDRAVFKVVYVVLESQYQSSLSAACKRINAGQVWSAQPRTHCTQRMGTWRLSKLGKESERSPSGQDAAKSSKMIIHL